MREGRCYEGETLIDVGMNDFGMRKSRWGRWLEEVGGAT